MENEYPGTVGTPFNIEFDICHFMKEGTILQTASGAKLRVVKVYRRTWWRRLLHYLGFRTRLFQAKVIQLKK